ncbi:MAG: trimeric intracellular cation channel family protein [Bacteroidota bacterium]|nr:trimeric intracellular cation channel family protein [Bacteroidota bacterium]
MKSASIIFLILDLAGTFVFALSGAVAARQKQLDIFGIFSVAFSVACGGGIVRDLCIGAIPPAGLNNWLYLMAVIGATVLVTGFYKFVRFLQQPVLLFDALGLAVFAVTGARKTLAFGYGAETAVLLGIVSAVGGGVIRDILLNRIPAILTKEIYASAALVGSLIVVAGDIFHYPAELVSIVAVISCFALRYLSLHFHLNLPSFGKDETNPEEPG